MLGRLRLGALLIATGLLAAVQTAGAAPYSEEIQEQLAIQEQVKAHWDAGNYRELDAMAAQFRRDEARTKSGFPKLAVFYQTFDKMQDFSLNWQFPHGSNWRKIGDWLALEPASDTATIVDALLLTGQANLPYVKHRAELDAAQGTEPVVDLAKAARHVLEDAPAVAERDPHWHTIMLRLMRHQGETENALIEAHEKALKAHPRYMQTSCELFEHLVAKWFPDARRIEAFANTVAENAAPHGDSAAVARLFSYAMLTIHSRDPFSLAPFNWPKIREGLERVLAEYPTAWNDNQLAYFSCIARDKKKTAEQFPKIEKAVVREIWASSIVYEQCKEWALDLQPQQVPGHDSPQQVPLKPQRAAP